MYQRFRKINVFVHLSSCTASAVESILYRVKRITTLSSFYVDHTSYQQQLVMAASHT